MAEASNIKIEAQKIEPNAEKIEVQQNLIISNQTDNSESQNNGFGQKATEEEIVNILKMLSPGTNFRSALDGIVRAEKGALIVLRNDLVLPIMDGGFKVNCRFIPSRLIELSKMDGAIILSKDGKRIEYANVLLTPNSHIPTLETGTRHKAAERTAKQTGAIVIAISERRKEITLYYKNVKHPIKDSLELWRKSNELLQVLERQRELFDANIKKLDQSEIKGKSNLTFAIQSIQKGIMIQKASEDLKKPMIEMGNEASMLQTRTKELKLAGVEKETSLVIKDYTRLNLKKSRTLLKSLSYDEVFDKENIMNILGYEKLTLNPLIKGWRLLSKLSLTEVDSAAIIKQLGEISRIVNLSKEDFKSLFNLDEIRAADISEELEKFKATRF